MFSATPKRILDRRLAVRPGNRSLFFLTRRKPSAPTTTDLPETTGKKPAPQQQQQEAEVELEPTMSARTSNTQNLLARDRAYLELLQEMDGGVSGVQTENGQPFGLKAQVKSDMKRVI
ncbi:hypothetical protein PhCBS80983_g00276 [Powellomyces hirtus]|uniref:Uncharacterized protein n=1 Tax=Powellomyces hirtus TaxID=109895 RepID=A0A507EFK0_9FUNG|nr:hypothetical protein PhCBS80983_g00276 [Powellomyces hirtus]